jgi:hypothetical protein
MMSLDVINLDTDEERAVGVSKKEATVAINLREINGKLFDKAYSDDPMIACQAVGKLVSTLQETTRQMGTREYDKALNEAFLGANRAWAELTRDKEPGRAMQTVRAILTFQLSRFAFDTRFTILDTTTFVGGK